MPRPLQRLRCGPSPSPRPAGAPRGTVSVSCRYLRILSTFLYREAPSALPPPPSSAKKVLDKPALPTVPLLPGQGTWAWRGPAGERTEHPELYICILLRPAHTLVLLWLWPSASLLQQTRRALPIPPHRRQLPEETASRPRRVFASWSVEWAPCCCLSSRLSASVPVVQGLAPHWGPCRPFAPPFSCHHDL